MFMLNTLQAVATGVTVSTLIASAFVSYNYIQDGNKLGNTKSAIEYTKQKILQASSDIDGDGSVELINPINKIGNVGEVPVNLGSGTDAFGRRFIYCAVDKGAANANAIYINTQTAINNGNGATQNPNVLGYLISKGKDGIANSAAYCTSTWDGNAVGDDIVYPIGIGEANHFKLYAGTEGVAGAAKAYNSAISGATGSVTCDSTKIGLLFYDTTLQKLMVCK